MFTEKDKKQMADRGSTEAAVLQQIENFKSGFPFMELLKAATPNDGIVQIPDNQLQTLVDQYTGAASDLDILKFVPASGAASRMFKELFAVLDNYTTDAFDQVMQGPVGELIKNLEKTAFFDALQDALRLEGWSVEAAINEKRIDLILEALLTDTGLDYGQLPKGLLLFHSYDDQSRTPFEEHLVEAAGYATGRNSTAKLHFTVSPEHQTAFEDLLNRVKPQYEKLTNTTFEVLFSIQKPATDTIAVDPANNPFRNDDSTILFRPGGHGALIENLNDQDADVIFIKNIDNVVPDRLKETTVQYKQALAAVLLNAQTEIFELQNKLAAKPEPTDIEAAQQILAKKLGTQPPAEFDNWGQAEKIDYLKAKLNRPIRVCGMVKNEGEPGGGPFWTKDADGTTSLQIVEKSQIDMDNPQQADLVQGATHFNPVDLVCGVRNAEGKPFNLPDFVDARTGFISGKSKNGRELKAQELPGLWNGAMANWNTIFVEVPVVTFNPVKTVNDLLRPNHL